CNGAAGRYASAVGAVSAVSEVSDFGHPIPTRARRRAFLLANPLKTKYMGWPKSLTSLTTLTGGVTPAAADRAAASDISRRRARARAGRRTGAAPRGKPWRRCRGRSRRTSRAGRRHAATGLRDGARRGRDRAGEAAWRLGRRR